MAEILECWKCGASIAHLPVPLSRRATCSSCGAELHACLMCKFYDKARSNQCLEPIADAVQYKHKANFCGYFQVKANARQDQQGANHARSAKEQLADLFGEDISGAFSAADPQQSKSELDELFGLNSDDESDPQNK